MPLPSPTRFGRYVVLDLLTGDPGEITLLAFDPELDRKVGLKVFEPSFDGEKEVRRRDKARALAAVVHPHIVRVHDVGVHDGQLYVAMDFVPGTTLLEWIRLTEPSWRRRLEVLLSAGEGLAAAHAAGLVHGAFSGQTVVVGDDGQVRVIDFVRSRPNRHGRRPDAARDRIDWCATVYRALWEGSPWDAEGRPRAPAVDTRVPWRVRRALLEGLKPDNQHATMRPLLDELRGALGRRRVAWGAALVLLACAGAAAAAVSPGPRPARPWCEGLDAHVTQVWSPDVARRGRESFAATGAPYAADVWDGVEGQVDEFVGAWRAVQARDCARRSEAERVDDSVTLCLHRQYQSLRAFVGVLQEADREVVASAARTAASLGSPASCEAVRDQVLPYGPDMVAAVMAIESVLAAARVNHELGRYAEGVKAAEDARAKAVELGLRALVAEADYRIAMSKQRLGLEEEAERGYHEAFSGAVAADHEEIVARAAMELAWLLAEQGRHDEAERWTEHAAAAVERRASEQLRTRLEAVRGQVAFHRGDYAKAREFYARSGELAERSDPPDAFAKMHARQVVALCDGRLGDTQAEIDGLQAGLSYVESELGSAHPNMGHYRNSLASALSRRGSVDLAIAEARQAQAIFRDALGPDNWATIANLMNLSATLHEAGREEEAEVGYAEALAAGRRTLSTEDARYATLLGNVGMYHALRGRYVEAAGLQSEAAARQEAISGPDHSFTLGFLNNLAATYMFSGNDQEAATTYRELLVRTERSLGADHPQLVPGLLGLATVEHRLGESAVAARRLERALQIIEARGDRPERIGRVQLTLAEVLWDADIDRARARSLARSAQQSYVAASEGGWDVGDQLENVRAWLADHGG